jgi:hypothetical protein
MTAPLNRRAADESATETAAAPTATEPRSYTSIETFIEAQHEWLSARAAMATPGEMSDEELSRRQDREWAAQRNLVATPARAPWAMWLKWELFEALLLDELEGSTTTWSLALVTLGALKADITAILRERAHV